ncbi:hypothetical protein [Zhongshania aliphaticivorans]|uniref:hypothetical protein n=1 Tax=Zhongshania aliphaticivorans TaxID=1470434 RepID=UPI0039C8D997
MSNFSGPADIYKELVENVPEDEEWLLGLVAFGVVEEQKIEWMKHHTLNNGGAPTTEEIENWYRQQPEGVLLRAKDTATARLTSYAQDAISAYMTEYENETREGILVEEIRSAKRFWPQFGVNLAGGFASAILFAALLTLFAFFAFNDSSPVDIGAKIGNHKEEVIHD